MRCSGVRLSERVLLVRVGSARLSGLSGRFRPDSDPVRLGAGCRGWVMAKLMEAYWPADRSVVLRDLTVGDLLREAATDSPDVVGLVAGVPGVDRRWTFAEMLSEAEKV